MASQDRENLYCMGEDDLATGQSMRAGFGCLLDVRGGRDSDLVLQQTFRVCNETCPYATSRIAISCHPVFDFLRKLKGVGGIFGAHCFAMTSNCCWIPNSNQ